MESTKNSTSPFHRTTVDEIEGEPPFALLDDFDSDASSVTDEEDQPPMSNRARKSSRERRSANLSSMAFDEIGDSLGLRVFYCDTSGE